MAAKQLKRLPSIRLIATDCVLGILRCVVRGMCSVQSGPTHLEGRIDVGSLRKKRVSQTLLPPRKDTSTQNPPANDTVFRFRWNNGPSKMHEKSAVPDVQSVLIIS
ncbi:hypothetical protein ACLOJK_001041 [Asimina triloba]